MATYAAHFLYSKDITQHFGTGCKSCELRPEMAPGLAELFVSFPDLLTQESKYVTINQVNYKVRTKVFS